MRVSAEKTSLTFTLISAKVLNLSFDPVGIFYVNNVNLALFKANEMMKRIVNSTVFGTGYATVPRALPRTKVELDYVIYYDSSQLEATDL